MGPVGRRYRKRYGVSGIVFDDNAISFKGVRDTRPADEIRIMEKLLMDAKRRAGKRRSKR
jgi:hypothetical protein